MKKIAVQLADYNVLIRAIDDRGKLRLLGWRDAEFIERLPKIVHERVPFSRSDIEMTMGVRHRAASVLLGSARRPAYHLGDEVFEPRGRHFVMGFVDGWIRIKTSIVHDAIDKIIHDHSDVIDSTQAVIEAFGSLLIRLHRSWFRFVYY